MGPNWETQRVLRAHSVTPFVDAIVPHTLDTFGLRTSYAPLLKVTRRILRPSSAQHEIESVRPLCLWR